MDNIAIAYYFSNDTHTWLLRFYYVVNKNRPTQYGSRKTTLPVSYTHLDVYKRQLLI